jgi:hypothetical protein
MRGRWGAIHFSLASFPSSILGRKIAAPLLSLRRLVSEELILPMLTLNKTMSTTVPSKPGLMCRRSEPRFPVVLPVRVWGMDHCGKAFSQPATTLVISLNGTRLDGVRVPLAPGDVVAVQYGQQKARFRVVWAGAPGHAREGQVGVWCLEGKKHLFRVENSRVEELAASQAGATGALPAAGEVPERGVERRQDERRRDERRLHVRHKCDGGAEVHKQGVDARVWGTLIDLSLGGCYMEMMTPFPSETLVELALAVGARRVRAGGLVRTSHPGCGMGIQFTEISEEDRSQLQQIVNALAEGDSKPAEPPRPASAAAAPSDRSDGNPSQAARVLQGILAFFGERDLLSRREFLEILQRVKSAPEARDPSIP